MNSNSIYNEIKKHLSIEQLHKMTTRLLEKKKAGKNSELKAIYEGLFDKDDSIKSENFYFLKLIKYFHPDRFKYISKQIESAYKNNNLDKLLFYQKILKTDLKKTKSSKFKYEHTERYEYDANDFQDSFYAEPENTQEFYDYSINEEIEDLDFVLAVKSSYLGNTNYNFTRSDLSNLTGELDLSAIGLSDLEGVEQCTYISGLNLSDNEISNLYDLQSLFNLKELYLSLNNITDIDYLIGLQNLEILDLSDNDIEDFEPLLKMESLKFVNIENNPISNKEIINKLEKKEVVVLH